MNPPKLPTDFEAEKWVIASVLTKPTVAAEVFSIIDPEHFEDELARAAVDAIYAAWQSGEPIDPLLVARKMREQGGDIADLTAEFLATCATQYPTAAHVLTYAKAVKEAYMKRKLLNLSQRLSAASQNGKASSDILSNLLSEASELTAECTVSADQWRGWKQSLHERNRLVHYRVGGNNSQLNRLCIGPGLFTLIGAPPGVGKTALAMQVVVDALLASDEITALVANCEVDIGVLLDRQLARLARVPFGQVRDRTFRGEDYRKVGDASQLLWEIKPRLHFLGPPFTMPRVRAIAASVKADIIVVDYVQRFKAANEGSDQRQQVSDVMSDCREIAMTGPAVIAVSAMSRQGQFRESSECEYACDTGFILKPAEEDSGSNAEKHLTAKCIKNRHGSIQDIELTFDGRFQEMTAPAEFDTYAEFENLDDPVAEVQFA